MRITFVMDGGDNLSGGHRAIAMFAAGLIQLGHDVTAVARPQRPPTVRDRARALLRGSPSVREPECKASHFTSAGVPLRILDRWRPIRDADLPDADIVLATWWETAEWVFRLPPSKGVKAHLMQDYEIWGGPAELVDASCALPIPKLVTADWLPDLLEKEFRQTAIAVISYGVDQRIFDVPVRAKQKVPTVGLTYSTLPRKGCDISIQAYLEARERVPGLRLVACGNCRISPELPLPEGAAYVAHASDHKLRELYTQCDAWLFGTRKEGFGLPMLEAMACRTPVIGTPAGAAPKLLANGAGIIVKPEDAGDMARAIVQVCSLSDAEWRALSDAAHDRASGFSWEKAVHAFETALREVLKRAGDMTAC